MGFMKTFKSYPAAWVALIVFSLGLIFQPGERHFWGSVFLWGFMAVCSVTLIIKSRNKK